MGSSLRPTLIKVVQRMFLPPVIAGTSVKVGIMLSLFFILERIIVVFFRHNTNLYLKSAESARAALI